MGRLKVQCYKVMVASHFIVALVEKELGKEEMGLSILNLNLNRLSEAFHGGLVVAIRMLENSELEMNPRVLGVCSESIFKMLTGLGGLIVRDCKKAQLVESLPTLVG